MDAVTAALLDANAAVSKAREAALPGGSRFHLLYNATSFRDAVQRLRASALNVAERAAPSLSTGRITSQNVQAGERVHRACVLHEGAATSSQALARAGNLGEPLASCQLAMTKYFILL